MSKETATLTAKELALYLGCEAECKLDLSGAGRLDRIKTRIEPLEYHHLGQVSAYYTVKPILWHLGDIPFDKIKPLGLFNDDKHRQNMFKLHPNWNTRGHFRATQFLKLLELGVDLFGFIEQGLAIRKA